jgi:hypothetical protein
MAEPYLRSNLGNGSAKISTAFAFFTPLCFMVTAPAAVAAVTGSQCISVLEENYGASPAFKLTCTQPSDCALEPSQTMNASAMAVVNAAARAVEECWRQSGYVETESVAAPTELHLVISLYRVSGTQNGEVCTLAEFKPFGPDNMTTFFRAACK